MSDKLKGIIAQGAYLERQKSDTVDELAQIIATTFSLLTNISPQGALYVLGELNGQLTDEVVEDLEESIVEHIESLSEAINLDGFGE